jgi:hypothetical protein
MDQSKDSKITGNGATPEPQATSGTSANPTSITSAKAKAAKAKDELPNVESPSVSPAISEPVAIEETPIKPKSEPEVDAARSTSTFALVRMRPFENEAPPELDTEPEPPRYGRTARYKRYAVLAASVTIGAAIGAVFGTLLTGGVSAPPVNVAAQEQSKAMQQSVARLVKEVTTLKASLDEASKNARAQVAKLDAKFGARLEERFKKEAAEITGSIAAPQTVAAVTLPAASAEAAPLAGPVPIPMPRPVRRVVSAESQLNRIPVVRDWSIHDARGGYVYVEGHGDIYQIVPGAPLPGLGEVESIKRIEGRWVVKTPKGIIVAMRDRRYFQ